jgi:hypothetical protein
MAVELNTQTQGTDGNAMSQDQIAQEAQQAKLAFANELAAQKINDAKSLGKQLTQG